MLESLGQLNVWVAGKPRPKGSWRAIKGKHGKVVMLPSNPDAKVWEKRVQDAASAIYHAEGERAPMAGEIFVNARFYISRPKSHYRASGELKPIIRELGPITRGTGDVDKLPRAILDALQKAGVFADDSQVTDLISRKRWANTGGVAIYVAQKSKCKVDYTSPISDPEDTGSEDAG